ncbi:hypothetical protein VCV18_004796 [Metarhizium anisopliae]
MHAGPNNSLLNRDVVPDAAKLALEPDAAGVIGRRENRVKGRAALRVGVVVVVLRARGQIHIKTYGKVAKAVVVPARDGVHQARRVEAAHHVRQPLLRVRRAAELAPALVVNDPDHERGVALVLLDKHLELALELGLLRRVGRAVAVGRQRGHVLDDEEAHLGAKEEDELAVEQGPLHAVDEAGRDGAEPRVAVHAVVAQRQRQVVQRGRGRRPQLRRRHAERELGVGRARCLPHRAAVAVHHGNGHLDALLLARHTRLTFSVHAGRHVELRNVVGRRALQPHRLPDARARAVKDVARVARLLADGDDLGVGGVVHKDEAGRGRQGGRLIVRSPAHVLGDVDGEAEIPADVVAGAGAVDKDGGLVVDGLKVEQDAGAAPGVGHGERAAEPHVRRVEALDAREAALDARRHQDLARERRRRRAVGARVGGVGVAKGPEAVEIPPVVAPELRPGVLGPRVRADGVGPVRVERRRLHLVRRRGALHAAPGPRDVHQRHAAPEDALQEVHGCAGRGGLSRRVVLSADVNARVCCTSTVLGCACRVGQVGGHALEQLGQKTPDWKIAGSASPF